MGQQEVYDFLLNKILSGDESFFSNKDIYVGMGRVCTLGNIVISTGKLYRWGQIQCKKVNNIPFYRVRKSEI